MPELIDDVRAALEAVRTHRGKKVLRMRGRTVSTPAHVEQAALLEGMTPEDFALVVASLDDPQVGIDQKTNQNETTASLLPGIAVFIGPGHSIPFSEGARWLTSGEFKCYLELGEEDNAGLYRELLVGPFRNFDLDNDHELPSGNFLTDPEWDFVVGEPRKQVFQLIGEIGFDPYAERPDESKPRGETWLAERSNWETEVERLKEYVKELEGKLAATATAPASSALPDNALELIQTAGSLSKPKAEAVLAALQASRETAPEPVLDEGQPALDEGQPALDEGQPALDEELPESEEGN